MPETPFYRTFADRFFPRTGRYPHKEYQVKVDHLYAKHSPTLQKAGLNPQMMFESWANGLFHENYSKSLAYLMKNISVSERLMRIDSNIPLSLVQNFGLKNFARYPITQLERQYHVGTTESEPKKSIVWIIAEHDHNRAMRVNLSGRLNSPLKFIKAWRNGYEVLVFEVGDNIFSLLNNMHSFGKEKLSLTTDIVISAHGDSKAFYFAQNSPISTEIYFWKNLLDYFPDDVKINLLSCYAAGTELNHNIPMLLTGRAQQPSLVEYVTGLTQRTVVGAIGSASWTWDFDHGKFVISPRYADKVISQPYPEAFDSFIKSEHQRLDIKYS